MGNRICSLGVSESFRQSMVHNSKFRILPCVQNYVGHDIIIFRMNGAIVNYISDM